MNNRSWELQEDLVTRVLPVGLQLTEFQHLVSF